MNLKLFNTRLSTESALADQQAINSFMDTVTVKKTATQFVPGNPDYWSILVFYENPKPNGAKAREEKEVKETGKQPVISEEDLNETERTIYAALRLWRKDRATEINLPEFMVFKNATLMTIAKEKPQDLLALSKIKGLGDQKIAKYGDDIVAILNAF
ncbi:MAG TPA: HRDC domain-containing protein [Saprospiraceae bacterium]|nr:HRDC domain-containing protein [Saprospiraceae bacterium]